MLDYLFRKSLQIIGTKKLLVQKNHWYFKMGPFKIAKHFSIIMVKNYIINNETIDSLLWLFRCRNGCHLFIKLTFASIKTLIFNPFFSDIIILDQFCHNSNFNLNIKCFERALQFNSFIIFSFVSSFNTLEKADSKSYPSYFLGPTFML